MKFHTPRWVGGRWSICKEKVHMKGQKPKSMRSDISEVQKANWRVGESAMHMRALDYTRRELLLGE